MRHIIGEPIGYLLFLIIAVFFSSCNSQVVFDENIKIPKEGWPATSPAYFDVEITDTLSYTSMYLNIKNNTIYPYSNAYFFISVMFPDGRMSRDTVNCILADNYGNWLGKGIGSEKTIQIPYRQGMLFPRTGTYRFYVEQAMRADTLQGITTFGIKLEKEKQ